MTYGEPIAGERLTLRERAVVSLLLGGASNKDIAKNLACSVKTVEFHISNMLRKTGTASRLELALRLVVHHT